MKLVNMKIPKRSKKELKEMSEPVYSGDSDKYPYGLCLRFDKESIDKLAVLKEVAADMPVEIVAKGYVKEVAVTDTKDEGRRRHNVEIQLTEVGIVTDKMPEKMSMKEYATWRGGK